jgi:hypothetical protein
MLCEKQLLALIYAIVLAIISVWILLNLVPSFTENKKYWKDRLFYISIPFSKFEQLVHIDDEGYDWTINLRLSHPYQILTVDAPVDVYGEAFKSSKSLHAASNNAHFAEMSIIKLKFQNSQKYPVTFDEDGTPRMGDLNLYKTSEDKMTGTARLSWPLEGQYKLSYGWEYENNSTSGSTVFNGAVITVSPKSTIIQMETNRALLILAIAALIIGAPNALAFILQLWYAP